LEACHAALSDAGLSPDNIEGITQYTHTSSSTEAPITAEVQRALGIPNLSFFADISQTGPSGLGPVMTAAMAVASGVCDTVLAYRTLPQFEGTTGHLGSSDGTVAGASQYTAVYGHSPGILANYALKKRRRMHEFGTSADEYGIVAINARRWAAHNPRALLRDPLTMDDYRGARTIIDPLVLFDCDYPVNASCALILASAERAHDLRHRPVFVDALAWGSGAGADFVFSDDLLYGGSIAASQRLWQKSRFTPQDINLLGLYDGFTHLPISWIEALGFCGFGEFHDWVDGGRRIGPGGELPLNTSGGMLAEGRIQGIGLAAEAVLQLRGDCGVRQIDAPRVAVVAGGGSNDSGVMSLFTE